MEYKINLEQFRNPVVDVFYGKTRGTDAREKLNLDKLDNSNDTVTFVIPIGISGISTSFYISLLSNSINRLGKREFDNKYQFEIEETSSKIHSILTEELNKGRRELLLINRCFNGNDNSVW